jgi:hypothetical protein
VWDKAGSATGHDQRKQSEGKMNVILNAAQLKQISERCKKSSAGMIATNAQVFLKELDVSPVTGEHRYPRATIAQFNQHHNRQNNLLFFVNARNDVLALLESHRELKKEVARLEAQQNKEAHCE